MTTRNVGKHPGVRTRRILQPLITVGLIALVSCVQPSGSRAAGESPATVQRKIAAIALEPFVAAADSTGLARAIDAACRQGPRSSCQESQLTAVAAAGHVKLAMGALGRLGAAHEDVKRGGHVYAHAIGIAAGQRSGEIEEIFGQCSESYQSGCYHGVIQARFAALDTIDAAAVNDLCAPFRTNDSQRWIRFQCVHGIGHGLTSLNKHDLPKGLAGCDLLTDRWDRHSCYGGAFMENIVNVTHPHHPASTLSHSGGQAGSSAAHDEHAGMPGMHHDETKPFKAVDPSDPQYPCSTLADRYLQACYQMQTSVMLYHNKGDIAGAARGCDAAPESMRITCYSSLGRDVSSYSLQDHASAIRMCSLGTPRYQPWCYMGLVKNIIDLNARPAEGISLCRDVPTPSSKVICYLAVGEQVVLLASDAEGRRSLCSTSEPAFLDACLYGARVSDARPSGLSEVLDAVKSR